jgi:hypothetical protein
MVWAEFIRPGWPFSSASKGEKDGITDPVPFRRDDRSMPATKEESEDLAHTC